MPLSQNGDGDWRRIGCGMERAQLPPAAQPDGIPTFWSQAQRKAPVENQDLLLLGPSSTGKLQQNFSGSFTDISWQPHDIKHLDLYYFFPPRIIPPGNNVSPKPFKPSTQFRLQLPSCRATNTQLSPSCSSFPWLGSGVSPIPRGNVCRGQRCAGLGC